MRRIVVLGAVVVSLLSLWPAVMHVAAGMPPLCQGQTPTVLGTSGNDTLTGSPGNDIIAGLAGDDVIRALDGKDHICSGDGNDHVIAGRGGDSVQDESGSNVIELGLGPDFDTDGPGSSVHDGGPGRDFVLDLDGADTYHLGSGDDTWDGGPGQNSVFGETGNDFLRPWHNVATVMGIVDNIVGGSGNDLVDYPATSADTGRVRFRASRAFVTTSAGGKTRITGIESAFGGPQRDRLIGNTKTNFLGGSNGVDVLIGKAGSDHTLIRRSEVRSVG
jgi:Ca2+-binding RTX toxin-like protein